MVDIAYADAYIAPLCNEQWQSLNDAEKQRYLTLAMRYIAQNYKLRDEAQQDDKFKQATCEVALILLSKGADYLFGNIKDKADVSSIKASSVEVKFEQGSQVQAPKIIIVDNLLKDLTIPTQGVGMARLVRA